MIWTTLAAALLAANGLCAEPLPSVAASTSTGRIASIYLSEDLINELLKENLQAGFLKDVVITLDAKKDQIVARGVLTIPTEDLRAINLEEHAGDFRFQLAIRPKTTRSGHLILIFPLDETFFYPIDSKNSDKDKIVVPVQLLSIALASARGHLAVLSGDLSGFDRKAAQCTQRIAELKRRLKAQLDPEERAALEHERKSVELELEAIPLERKRGEKLAKKMERFLGFVGEKEIDLNQELSARRNALILRVKVGKLAPYLQGIELGGVRLRRYEKGGFSMNFLALDIDADLAEAVPYAVRPQSSGNLAQRPPQVAIRLNQALFESRTLLNAEKEEMSEHLRNLTLRFKEDGVHLQGGWKVALLPQLPFASTLDFVWTAPNAFEVRVRELKVAHFELTSLTRLLLSVVKRRLDKALKGACAFEYLGEVKDGSRAMRVTVDMSRLLPAFPHLVLTDVDVRENELILKAGKI